MQVSTNVDYFNFNVDYFITVRLCTCFSASPEEKGRRGGGSGGRGGGGDETMNKQKSRLTKEKAHSLSPSAKACSKVTSWSRDEPS